MNDAASVQRMALEQDQRISEVVKRERSRLGNFIRRRVPDPRDAEDILQEVFYELVEANRLLMPIDHVTGWLFRVARNRIIDLFRKKKPESFSDAAVEDEDGELLRLEDLLPSPDAGPEALYARSVLLDELEAALDELPDEQREVFVAHELEGLSFKEIAAETGVSVNTLLSRKRYAVLHLRERLAGAFTTNLRKHEGTEYEKENDFHGSAGDSGDAAIYLHRRRSSAASVELAAAAALRLAPDYVLAGSGNSGAVPDTVRRLWRPRLPPLQLAAAHGRALAAHDARGAGKIPAGYARTVRLRCTPAAEAKP
jgi:RNA polymerase sigma factor (sigma-70 family)